ncbi:hypothetical protein QYE76_007021 [Lolium multiflorum]|uniref:Transposase (putative) gypsy type domain-containing protein n=1 Tax=Lolium multiflorum TaxID=4521 RepID=A0AAD8RW36_LOLMU|nr:hypothetical protein QYE76_007021 [Lolium multiflorum]
MSSGGDSGDDGGDDDDGDGDDVQLDGGGDGVDFPLREGISPADSCPPESSFLSGVLRPRERRLLQPPPWECRRFRASARRLEFIEFVRFLSPTSHRGKNLTVSRPPRKPFQMGGDHGGRAGFSLPPRDFFTEILKAYKLQPHNISPNNILAISNHVNLCEGHLRLEALEEKDLGNLTRVPHSDTIDPEAAFDAEATEAPQKFRKQTPEEPQEESQALRLNVTRWRFRPKPPLPLFRSDVINIDDLPRNHLSSRQGASSSQPPPKNRCHLGETRLMMPKRSCSSP